MLIKDFSYLGSYVIMCTHCMVKLMDITNVCGLTLQSLIAVTTDIESREFKRVANVNL